MLETEGKKNLKNFWKILLIFPIKKNFNEIKFNKKQKNSLTFYSDSRWNDTMETENVICH